MANNTIEIVLKAKDEASKVIKGISGGFKDFQKTAKEVGTQFAVIGAATGAVIYDITNAAANYTQAAQAMEQQFGVSSDTIVSKLSEVADGTINNTDLILAANRSMALNVTKDVGQMAELLEFARVRARAMGTDTTSAFNDIVTGIGRGSPMILDNLGIITKGWNEEATAAGVAYDSQFILNKVLEQGRDVMEQVGDVQMTTKEQTQALWASVDNLKVEFGEQLLPIMADVIGAFSGVLEWVKQLTPEQKRLAAEVLAGVAAFTAISGAALLLIAAINPITIAIGAVIAGFVLLTIELDKQGLTWAEFGLAVQVTWAETEWWIAYYVNLAIYHLRRLTMATDEELQAMAESMDADLAQKWQKVAKGYEDLNALHAEKQLEQRLAIEDSLALQRDAVERLTGETREAALAQWTQQVEEAKMKYGEIKTGTTAEIEAMRAQIAIQQEAIRKESAAQLAETASVMIAKFTEMKEGANLQIDSIASAWQALRSALANPISAVVKITQMISSMMSGSSSSSKSTSTKKAQFGGKVQGGRPVTVGEAGAELFLPDTSGRIMPNYRLAGAGAGGVQVNINGGFYLDERAAEHIGDLIIEKLKSNIRL